MTQDPSKPLPERTRSESAGGSSVATPSLDPALIDTVRAAKSIVIFTGAGVSAESGIPTFRDHLTGLWERFDAESLATRRAFTDDPTLVWGWYEWRRMKVLAAQPNAAHRAIAAMAEYVRELTVITQNVDDLHERAGSQDVIHLHGDILHPRCFACGRKHGLPDGMPAEPEGGRRLEPPRCGHCGGRIRPNVVWFGEELPTTELARAFRLAQACDVLFSVGTSSFVYPAADIPRRAAEHGATVIQINPSATALDHVARFNLRLPASEVIPGLVRTTWPDTVRAIEAVLPSP